MTPLRGGDSRSVARPDTTGFHSLVAMGRGINLLLGARIALGLVGIAAHLDQLRLVGLAVRGGPLSVVDIDFNRSQQELLGGLETALLIVTAGFFITWLLRARDNVAIIGGAPSEWSRFWVVAGWFVPGLNFWRPKEVIDDIYRRSAPPAARGTGPVPRVVNWWWGLLVAAAAASVTVEASFLLRPRLGELRAIAVLVLVAEVFWVGSAGLAMLVVRGLGERQEARARRAARPEG